MSKSSPLVEESVKTRIAQIGHQMLFSPLPMLVEVCCQHSKRCRTANKRRWGHCIFMLEVQLAFHKGHVCTCGQLEVQLSQQHGRLWKIYNNNNNIS